MAARGPSLLLLGAGLILLCLTSAHGTGSSCKDVTFHVTVTAENTKFANLPDPKNDTAVLNYFLDTLKGLDVPNGPPTNGTTTIKGTFPMSGTHCAPPPGVPDRGVLQLLVHGLTYNRSYWSGFDLSPTYNWPLFATTHGYHTLAIDLLGHGLSHAHPDPVSALQVPLHTELLAGILTTLRHPANPLRPAPFRTLALVGHSFGSVLGVALANAHPDAVDALVLTAYSTRPFAGALAALEAAIGSAHALPRFARLPPGYAALGSEAAREATMYAGDYDPAVAAWDFQVEDTLAPGELLVQSQGFVPAAGFRKPVLVVTGEEDAVLCNPDLGEACADVLRDTGAAIFADARPYDFYVPPKTGHSSVLHRSAPVTFGVVTDWLDRVV